MGQQIALPSFAGGEFSPALFGRIDFTKYHTAAAYLRNMVVDFHGGVYNRPGTLFVGPVKDSTKPGRLIPFVFSNGQAYVLVFGHQTLRIVQNGGYITEAAKVINSVSHANPCVVGVAAHGFSNGDLVFIESSPGMPYLSGAEFLVAGVTTNTFTLTDIYGNVIDSTFFGTYSGGGSVARIYTAFSPYSSADLAVLKYNQSADTAILTHPGYPPYKLQRSSNTSWTFSSAFTVPIVDPPAIGSVVASNTTGTTEYAYVVTSVSAVNGQESVASIGKSCINSATMSSTAGAHITVSIAPNTWSLNSFNDVASYNIYRTPEVAGGSPGSGSAFGYVGAVAFGSQIFVDSNIQPDFTRQPPLPVNPFNQNLITDVQITNGGTGYAVGDKFAIWPQSTSYGTPTYCYVTSIGSGGAITGIAVGQQGTLGSQSSYIVYQDWPSNLGASHGVGSGAVLTPVFAGSPSYPTCSCFFQQRLVFGGFSGNVTEFLASKTGDYYNFSYSSPSQASDSIQVSILSSKVNIIKHLVPMTSMVALSYSGAWRVDSGQLYGPVTPTSILAAPQGYAGAADPIPIVVNYDILYVQARGSVVRDLSYNFFVNVYTGNDISAMSSHLFFPHTIVQWTWAEEPNRTVWAVRDDGVALSLTFVKEQEVIAWAHSDTQGSFLDVCSIPEGNIDAVYFLVGRWINGVYAQFVERLDSRDLDADPALQYPADPSRAWFVDAGLSYEPISGDTVLFPFGTSGTFNANFMSNSTPAALAVVPGAILRFNGGWFLVNSISTSVPGVPLQANLTSIIPSSSLQSSPVNDWSVGTPATTVYGLWHLNNMPVTVLADGSPVSGIEVKNGTITLPNAASDIKIGLGYSAQFQSLPINPPTQGAQTSQGKRIKVSAATVRMKDSRGIKIGPSWDRLLPFKERAYNIPLGVPLPLFTGDERIIVEEDWAMFNQICMQQDDPLPMTVLGIWPEVVVGDTVE